MSSCLLCIHVAMLEKRQISVRSVLSMKTRQALMEKKKAIKCIKYIQAGRNSYEGLLNDMCEISAVTKFS